MLRESPGPGRDDAPGAVAAPPATTVHVQYYTDPLCSWSWALEPQWRRLRYELGDQLTWEYRMGGMIADWQSFSDPMNVISRPIQLGPQWFQVRVLSGMALDDRIWLDDPPASSYPAGVAFHAAARQGPAAAEAYLRRLREAVMLDRRNIARPDVLTALAAELAADDPAFDAERFAADLTSAAALAAFTDDLKEAGFRGIGRFPTLVLRTPDGDGRIIVGYRPYPALRAALADLAPAVAPGRRAADPVAYVGHWGGITAREVAEALEQEPAVVAAMLDAAVDAGRLAAGDEPAGDPARRYRPA